MGHIENDKVLATISQRQGPFCIRNFTLFPNRLQVEENRLTSRFRRYVYLGALKEEPDLVREPLHAFSSIVWALVIISVGILGAREKTLRPFVPLGLLVLIVVLIRKGVAFRAFRKVMVLGYQSNRYGKAGPSIWLRRDRPSEQAVQSFLGTYRVVYAEWQEYMEQRSHAGSTVSHADALRSFSQLLADGILTKEEFAVVKESIMGGAKGPIGLRPR